METDSLVQININFEQVFLNDSVKYGRITYKEEKKELLPTIDLQQKHGPGKCFEF